MLRNFFENLRNFLTFKRKTGKESTLFMILAQLDKILQNFTCFYGIRPTPLLKIVSLQIWLCKRYHFEKVWWAPSSLWVSINIKPQSTFKHFWLHYFKKLTWKEDIYNVYYTYIATTIYIHTLQLLDQIGLVGRFGENCSIMCLLKYTL